MILPLIRLGTSTPLPAGEVIGPFTIKIRLTTPLISPRKVACPLFCHLYARLGFTFFAFTVSDDVGDPQTHLRCKTGPPLGTNVEVEVILVGARAC